MDTIKIPRLLRRGIRSKLFTIRKPATLIIVAGILLKKKVARQLCLADRESLKIDAALPIAAIQGESWMFRDEQSGLLVANWLPDNVNHFKLSHTLTNDLRRDFTYLHPEDFVNGKLTADGPHLVLNNKVNRQEYKVLILPGGDVISCRSLAAIKDYYDGGGRVVATSSLPTRSSEFGRDGEVRAIVAEIFGAVPQGRRVVSNDNGGMFAFLPDSDADELGIALDLRGRVRRPEIWDPHSGKITAVPDVRYENGNTVIELELDPVKSTFIVGRKSERGLQVKVTGTKFNLSAYSDERNVRTTLFEGSVELHSKGGAVNLASGDMATFDCEAETFTMAHDVPLAQANGWMEKKLYMDNMPLSELCRTLERWYDVKITVPEALGEEITYTGVLQEESVAGIMNAINELSGINYKIDGQNIAIMPR